MVDDAAAAAVMIFNFSSTNFIFFPFRFCLFLRLEAQSSSKCCLLLVVVLLVVLVVLVGAAGCCDSCQEAKRANNVSTAAGMVSIQ